MRYQPSAISNQPEGTKEDLADSRKPTTRCLGAIEMANPTGTTYLTANSGYLWTDGDVYEIVQTDQQEGAAIGASFGGQGVDNQPHQILLNKIQYTHSRQITDETNITVLQAFKGLFTSRVGANGYLKLGAQDVNLGQTDIILQWGVISLLGVARGMLVNGAFTFSFSIPFPNAVWRIIPWFESNNASGEGALFAAVQFSLVPEAITPYALQGNTIFTDYVGPGSAAGIRVASSPNDGVGLTGIGWVAIGY
jgi:hypothetical protein